MANHVFRRQASGRLTGASLYTRRTGDAQAPIARQFFETPVPSTPVIRPSLSTRVIATSQATAVASLTTASRTTVGGAGSVMFICAAMNTPGTAPTVSDSKSNTWTLVTSGARASVGGSYYLWRCVSPTGGAGHTFTVSYSGGTSPLTMIALEAVNCQNDVTGSFTLDSAVPFTTSITTTGTNDLVLVFNSSDTSSYSSPFNIGETYIDPSTGWSLSHGWAEGLPAATYTVTIPAGASSDMQVVAVALKAAAAGGATVSAADPTSFALTAVASAVRMVSSAAASSFADTASASAGRLVSSADATGVALTAADSAMRLVSSASSASYALTASASAAAIVSGAAPASYSITALDATGSVGAAPTTIVSSADPAFYDSTVPATSAAVLRSGAASTSLAISSAAAAAALVSSASPASYSLGAAAAADAFISVAAPSSTTATPFTATAAMRSAANAPNFTLTAFNATGITSTAGGYPDPGDVRAGVVYGPGGIYTGTLVSTGSGRISAVLGRRR